MASTELSLYTTEDSLLRPKYIRSGLTNKGRIDYNSVYSNVNTVGELYTVTTGT